MDFKVKPYARVLEPKITVEGGKIKATFKVNAGYEEVNNIGLAYLCVGPDRFVTRSNKQCSKDPGAVAENNDPAGGETITLEVDPERIVDDIKVNADEFQYDRDHFVRIAVVGAHYGIVPAWDEEKTESVFDMAACIAAGSPSDWWNYFVTVTTTIHHEASYTNDGTVNSESYYNYSPVYKVNLKSGSVTEVTDW